MRIISGKFKGKKIIQPKDIQTRPLKDLTKESIFNIIKHSKKFSINLKESEILDLFSGTGSFGIECLSREAKFVTFVENYLGIFFFTFFFLVSVAIHFLLSFLFTSYRTRLTFSSSSVCVRSLSSNRKAFSMPKTSITTQIN